MADPDALASLDERPAGRRAATVSFATTDRPTRRTRIGAGVIRRDGTAGDHPRPPRRPGAARLLVSSRGPIAHSADEAGYEDLAGPAGPADSSWHRVTRRPGGVRTLARAGRRRSSPSKPFACRRRHVAAGRRGATAGLHPGVQRRGTSNVPEATIRGFHRAIRSRPARARTSYDLRIGPGYGRSPHRPLPVTALLAVRQRAPDVHPGPTWCGTPRLQLVQVVLGPQAPPGVRLSRLVGEPATTSPAPAARLKTVRPTSAVRRTEARQFVGRTGPCRASRRESYQRPSITPSCGLSPVLLGAVRATTR